MTEIRPLFNINEIELVVPNSSYAEAMVEHMKRNREHFKYSSPVSNNFFMPEYWEKRLKQANDDFLEKKSMYVIFQKQNEPTDILGSFCFDNIVRGPFQACYLGYRMDKDHVKKGLMYQGLKQAIEYVFNEWHVHRIMANYRPENTASGKLLEKLGFTIEGYAKKYLFLDGAWQDHILTSLTNHNISSVDL